jgi:peptidoglycan/LPS O-acetylase OafA/YrhL
LHAIEVARGIASGWVLLFHSLAALPADSLHPVLQMAQRFTSLGWLGVHIFFAISGWCIAERLAAAYRRGESCRGFLRERVLRIFPTYWAAFALLLLTRLVAMPFNHTPPERNFPVSGTVWIGDLLLINPYLGVPATLMVSWSLVFELGFYALGAGALLLRRHGLASAVIAALGMFLCAGPLLHVESKATYVLGLWPDFFAGALVWWSARVPTAKRTVAGIAGLSILLVLALTWPGGYGGLARTTALATAAALWLASRHNRSGINGNLSRALAWLGVCSYSLYLVHLTVLSPFLNLAQRAVPPSNAAFVVVWLAALALGVGAGWLLHRFVESPVELWRKSRWSHRRI